MHEKLSNNTNESVSAPRRQSTHATDNGLTLVSNYESKEEDVEFMHNKNIDEVMNLDKAELKQNKVFGSYVTYTMTNNQGEKIERKFNDFVLLRKAFAHNFPGWYIPKIPEKRMGIEKVKDDKSENFELRKNQLDDFIEKLSTVSHLVSSDIYKAFTRSKANVNNTLKRYLNPSKRNILDRMKDVFFNLSGKEINAELVNKIENFESSLKIRLPILKQFKTIIRQNIESFEEDNIKISNLMGTLGKFEDVFLNYTKDISGYSNSTKGDILSENIGSRFNIFNELHREQKCPFYSLEAFINKEISDYEAFLEALKVQRNFLTMRKRIRYRLDQQLELFNSQDFQNYKDDRIEKIQQKLESLEIEFNEMDLICNIMVVAMGYYEMDRFEIEKYRLYCENIASFWKDQISNQNEILGFFQYLKNFSTISSEH